MAEARVPYLTVGGVTLPPLNVVLPLSITIGRSDPTSQPDANALTFGWRAPILPANLHRGAPITIGLTSDNPDIWTDIWDDIWQGETYDPNADIRFRGTVADISAQADPVGGMVLATILCIGTLTDLADQIVGDEAWPVETDQQRVSRVAALVRTQRPLINEGSPDLRLRRKDVDRRKALEVLHLFAGSVGSILWEYPDGTIHYQGFDHREVPGTAIYLPSTAIITDAQWAQSTDQLIDRVRVEYGDDPEDGERAEFVAGTGVHEVSFSGEVADLSGATAIGAVILERWSRTDLWDAPQISTRSDILDPLTYEALLTALPSDLVVTENLTVQPSPGRSGEGVWFVEGWEEVWDRAGSGAPLVHEFRLAVSDSRRFIVTGEQVVMTLTVVEDVVNGIWTATVTRVDDTYFPSAGTLSLTIDGHAAAQPANINPDSQWRSHTWVEQNLLPPGPHTWVASYSGYPGVAQPATSNAVTLTLTPPPAALQVALRVDPTQAPHVGDQVMFTAKPYQNPEAGVPVGTIGFQFSYGGGVWTTAAYVDAPGGNEPDVTWLWTVPDGRRITWVAVFYPHPPGEGEPPSPWAPAQSNQLVVWPLVMKVRQSTYEPTDAQNFNGLGDYLNDTGLRQGDWDDGTGDNRALVMFPDLTVTTDAGAGWVGTYVTKVEFFLAITEWEEGDVGVVRLGSHPYVVMPNYDVEVRPGSITPRSDVAGWAQGTGKWVDITTWGRELLSPAKRATGVSLGPAGVVEDAARVGGLNSSGDTTSWDGVNPFTTWDTVVPPATIWDGGEHKPLLRVTGYKWERQ